MDDRPRIDDVAQDTRIIAMNEVVQIGTDLDSFAAQVMTGGADGFAIEERASLFPIAAREFGDLFFGQIGRGRLREREEETPHAGSALVFVPQGRVGDIEPLRGGLEGQREREPLIGLRSREGEAALAFVDAIHRRVRRLDLEGRVGTEDHRHGLGRGGVVEDRTRLGRRLHQIPEIEPGAQGEAAG